mmetsp:Transcript_36931/g.37581  ORF Transcript_36931/g.37581 Transcript_36931/m.37581 type:complete len:161 (-) Transcript_36931:8-490(-)
MVLGLNMFLGLSLLILGINAFKSPLRSMSMCASDKSKLGMRFKDNQTFPRKIDSNVRRVGIVTLLLGFSMGFSGVVKADDEKKKEKKYETCLSKCIYQGTRTPQVGASMERLEAKSRSEVLIDCKKLCAKTKSQLLTGKIKPGVDNTLTLPNEKPNTETE